VILDEDQATALDQQSGESLSRIGKPRSADSGDGWGMTATGAEYDDLGGASRFFYVAKADASERPKVGGVAHPTVKPLTLMRWLVRLVTPPGGVVLEPFAGSGTTVEACLLEGFRCIAIEKGDEYLPLIEARIHRRRDPVAAARLAATGDDEASLFDLLNEEGA
jgi:site-specific DNA-methyltransferase (adenine-specific)